MTPFAQRIFRNTAHLIGGPDGQLPQMIGQAACFEISEIIPTIYDTADDLAKHPTIIDHEHFYDHGGLLFMPSPVVWMEFVTPTSGKLGLLLNEADGEIGVNMFATGLADQHAAFLEMRDGDLYCVRPQSPLHGIQDEKVASEAAVLASIALMLINAPKGVLRKPQLVHKGLVREAKRCGIGPLRPSHKIVLDINAGDVGGGDGSGQPSEKAFHYCRSHVRRLSPDRTIVVRGHWRGNPAIGTTRGDYIVRGDRLATIH